MKTAQIDTINPTPGKAMTINALTTETEIDRRTIKKYLKGVPPDEIHNEHKLYTTRTLQAAMEKAVGKKQDREPNLLRMIAHEAQQFTFEEACLSMVTTLPLAARQADVPIEKAQKLAVLLWTGMGVLHVDDLKTDAFNIALKKETGAALDDLWRRAGHESLSEPPKATELRVPIKIQEWSKQSGLGQLADVMKD